MKLEKKETKIKKKKQIDLLCVRHLSYIHLVELSLKLNCFFYYSLQLNRLDKF